MDLEVALKFVNSLLVTKVGRELRPPEITVFTGTWQGMTYEQMAASSSYSANYLMRDIAPKFWKLLSELLGENIGKTNLRLAIRKMDVNSYESTTPLLESEKLASKAGVRKLSWGNAPSIPSHFYGYERELAILQKWVRTDRCQLLGLWGLSGTGKTLLLKKLAEEIQTEYRVVIWRSLAAKPHLSELLQDLLRSGFGIIENNSHKLLPRLLEQMRTAGKAGASRSHSCLILLDGIEAILQPQALSGQYLPGYENYGEFFRVVGKSAHQSCLVITSLENPEGIMPAASNNSLIRNLKLSGLVVSEARDLLRKEKLTDKAAERRLIEYYQGNPAILTTVARIIWELFGGNVTEFLAQKSLVFGEIDRILSKSFNRLSVLEREILYWLAGEVQPMSLSEIQKGIPFSIYPVELIEALESLSQRAWIETSQREQRTVFVLFPMMREFVTNQFIAQIGNNFSLAKRKNSLLGENTIELGTKKKEPTHLSQWLQNRFELGWQPVETLFVAPERSPARLRSAFNLRGDGVVTRFKEINLGANNPISVLLLVAVTEKDDAIEICVQAQPVPQQQILPSNLQLSLVDPDNTVLATIESEVEDNFIQLPYFRGVANENFHISLNLNSASYKEDFRI